MEQSSTTLGVPRGVASGVVGEKWRRYAGFPSLMVAVDVEVLQRSTGVFKRAQIRLVKGSFYCIYPDEDVSAAVEVLTDEGLGRRAARLQKLKVLHEVLGAAGEVLYFVRPGIRCTGEELTW